MITLRVRTFAGFREALGFSETQVALPIGTDVAGLAARLAADYPAARLTTRRYPSPSTGPMRRPTGCWLTGMKSG